jgi:hypothetical protein
MIMLGRGFEFSQGDQGYGKELGFLGFRGRCRCRGHGKDGDVLRLFEGDTIGAPVDGRVPQLQPGFAKDDVVVNERGHTEVDSFIMVVKAQVRGKDGLVARTSCTIGKGEGDIYNVMESKRETSSSIGRDKVAHGTTIYQDLDGGMVECSLLYEGFATEFRGFTDAADEQWSLHWGNWCGVRGRGILWGSSGCSRGCRGFLRGVRGFQARDGLGGAVLGLGEKGRTGGRREVGPVGDRIDTFGNGFGDGYGGWLLDGDEGTNVFLETVDEEV